MRVIEWDPSKKSFIIYKLNYMKSLEMSLKFIEDSIIAIEYIKLECIKENETFLLDRFTELADKLTDTKNYVTGSIEVEKNLLTT